MGLWGIVVAGGSGTRFGTLKQLEPLGGRRVLDLAVAALANGPKGAAVDGVVVVVPSALVGAVDLPGDVAVLERAHDAASNAGSATDDASLVDAIGETVLHVDGDPENLKITTPADLVVAESLLARAAEKNVGSS